MCVDDQGGEVSEAVGRPAAKKLFDAAQEGFETQQDPDDDPRCEEDDEYTKRMRNKTVKGGHWMPTCDISFGLSQFVRAPTARAEVEKTPNTIWTACISAGDKRPMLAFLASCRSLAFKRGRETRAVLSVLSQLCEYSRFLEEILRQAWYGFHFKKTFHGNSDELLARHVGEMIKRTKDGKSGDPQREHPLEDGPPPPPRQEERCSRRRCDGLSFGHCRKCQREEGEEEDRGARAQPVDDHAHPGRPGLLQVQ